MHEAEHLFIELQPPGGGLLRLQQRLAQQAGRRHPRHFGLVMPAALALVALTLLVMLPGMIAQRHRTATLTSAVQAAVAPPANGIEVVDGAALALPSGNPEVKIYLVQSARPLAQAGRH